MKKKLTLCLLIALFAMSMLACSTGSKRPSSDTDSTTVDTYAVEITGNTSRTMEIGDTDTLMFQVLKNGEAVEGEEVEVTVLAGASVEVTSFTATQAVITAKEAGNSRVKVALKNHNESATVTYSITRPSLFGEQRGSWNLTNEANGIVSIEGGQSAILFKQSATTWMASAKVDVSDYNSGESFTIGSFLNCGDSALWFALRNSDRSADGRFSVYVRDFYNGWDKVSHEGDVNGYTKNTGIESIPFTLIRRGTTYYYNIAGMYGTYENAEITGATYPGFQTQNIAMTLKDFTVTYDEAEVSAAVDSVYTTGKVGNIQITVPSSIKNNIICSGINGVSYEFTAQAYSEGKAAESAIVWSIDTQNLQGNATIEGGVLTVEGGANGSLKVIASSEDASVQDSCVFTVLVEEEVYENEFITAKGGVLLNDDGSIEFPKEKVSNATISDEANFSEDYAYAAFIKERVIGDFSLEFTVSDYVANVASPKLMFSFGANHNNIFLVYSQSFVRFEAFVDTTKNGFTGQWFQGEGMSDFVNTQGATRYKIAVEQGCYALYASVDGAWKKISITQDGASLDLVREYNYYTHELPIVIAVNGCSCKISDMVLTNGSAEDAPTHMYVDENGDFLSYNSVTDFTDENANFVSKFTQDGWLGRDNNTTTVNYVKDLPATFSLSYRVEFSHNMTDSKLVAMIGNYEFHILNKLNNGELSATYMKTNDWSNQHSNSDVKGDEERVAYVNITRDDKNVISLYINDKFVHSEVATDATLFKFYTFNEKGGETGNEGYLVKVSDFTVGEYAPHADKWTVTAEKEMTLKVNETTALQYTVKLNGEVQTEYNAVITSSNEDVVTVTEGQVQAKKAGTAQLTVAIMGESGELCKTVINVTVPEVNYQINIKNVVGGNVVVKTFGTFVIDYEVTADAQVSTQSTVTIDATDVVSYDAQTKTFTGLKVGTANVTITVDGTTASATFTITVSEEVEHNYVLGAGETERELFTGDYDEVSATLSDNGSVVTECRIEFTAQSPLTVEEGRVTVAEGQEAGQYTLTVSAYVGEDKVAETTITYTVTATVYTFEVTSAKSELIMEDGNDSDTPTVVIKRNGVDADIAYMVSESNILSYANGIVKAVAPGEETLVFTLDGNRATASVTYSVTKNTFNTTKKRGNVTVDGNNVVIVGGNAGIAGPYSAKIWRISANMVFEGLDGVPGHEVGGFSSGINNNDDTFNSAMVFGYTLSDVMGLRYIEWLAGWGNGQRFINVEEGYYSHIDATVANNALNNKAWELIRYNDDYYFTYGDFWGKLNIPCESATMPGILVQYGRTVRANNVEISYDTAEITALVEGYATKPAYSVKVNGNTQQEVGLEQDFGYTLFPAICTESVTFSLDTTGLTSGSATLQESRVILSMDAVGQFVLTATTASGKSASITVTVSGEPIITKNDVITVKGGLVIDNEADGGYSVNFNDSTKNGIGSESKYVDEEYSLNFNEKVIGNFSLELTVSDYNHNNIEYPKLMISLGGTHNQFYIAYKPNGEYRVETLTEHMWPDGGFSTDDNAWANTDNFQEFDTAAAHTYKFAVVDGAYHIYVDGVEHFLRLNNADCYAYRRYDDYRTEQPIRISTNGVTCKVSNIKLTNGSAEDMPKFYGYVPGADSYNAETDTLTIKLNHNGWNSPHTVRYTEALPANCEITFKVSFSQVTADTKLGMRLGGGNYIWFENKSDIGIQAVTGGWGNATAVPFGEVNVKIVRNGETVTLYLNELEGKVWDYNASDMLDFVTFNENTDYQNVTASVTGFAVKAL